MTDREDQNAASNTEENGLVLEEDESDELKEVFSTIFPQYLLPLEELVGQLLEGKTSPEIIEGLRGAAAPLTSAATSIGATQLESVLREFQDAVDRVTGESELDEATRNDIIDVFYRLKETVQSIGTGSAEPAPAPTPSTFVKRLSAIDGVGSAEVQQILAAGITSAEQVSGARVDEIAAVTGLDEALARRIYQEFGGTKRRRETADHSAKPRSQEGGVGERSDRRRSDRQRSRKSTVKSQAGTLEGRLALMSLVRERIRLGYLLQREKAASLPVQSETDEVAQANAFLQRRLQQMHEVLGREKERVREWEREIASLRDQIERVKQTTERVTDNEDGDKLEELQTRLKDLRLRAAGGLRRGG